MEQHLDPDQPLVRKQLMAYQRVLNLADDTADRQMLLSKGHDSAMAIAAKTESEFVQSSGLALGQARMIYANAREHALQVSHSFQAMWDGARGQFRDIALNNQDPQLINDLREIDGFDEIFGPQDFATASTADPFSSPAAYFVDLMHYVEQHVSEPVFISLPNGRPPSALPEEPAAGFVEPSSSPATIRILRSPT